MNNNQNFDDEDFFKYKPFNDSVELFNDSVEPFNDSVEPFNNSVPQDFVDSKQFTYSSAVPKYNGSRKSLPKALGCFSISIISFVVVSIVVSYNYDIQYVSIYRSVFAALPTIALFEAFYRIGNGTNIAEAITLCLIDFILSYLLFYFIMANGLHKMYSMLSLKEAWDAVDALRHISSDTKDAFYEQLLHITGMNCLFGIALAVQNVKQTNKRWKV